MGTYLSESMIVANLLQLKLQFLQYSQSALAGRRERFLNSDEFCSILFLSMVIPMFE